MNHFLFVSFLIMNQFRELFIENKHCRYKKIDVQVNQLSINLKYKMIYQLNDNDNDNRWWWCVSFDFVSFLFKKIESNFRFDDEPIL